MATAPTAITVIEIDAGPAERGARAFAAAAETVKSANAAAVASNDRLQKTVQETGRGYQRLRAVIDPVGAAQEKLATRIDLVNNELIRGRITAERAAQDIARLNEHYATQAQRATAAAAAQEQAAIATERSRQAAENAQHAYNRLLGVTGAVTGSARTSASVFEEAARAEEEAARSAAQLAAANENLRRRYVPLHAAQQQHLASLSEIRAAEAAGVLSRQEATAAIRQQQAVYTQQTRVLAGTAQPMQAAYGRYRQLGAAVQQAGFQVGDFAVQVASGQGVLRPFIQQGTQLISMFGPWGAVIGAAGAVVGALAVAFLDFGDAADQAADAIKAYDDIIGDIDGNLQRAIASGRELRSGLDAESTDVEDLTRHYARLSATMRDVEAIRLTALGNQAREAIAGERAALAGLLDDVEDAAELSRRMSEVGNQIPGGLQQPPDVLRMVEALDAFRTAAPDDVEALGRLAVALDDVAKAGGPFSDEARRAADALADPATKAVELADKLKLLDANMAVLRGAATASQVALLNLGSGTRTAATEAGKLADQRADSIAGLQDELRYQQDLRAAHLRGADAVRGVELAREADLLVQRLKLKEDDVEVGLIEELIRRRDDERRGIEGIAEAQKKAVRSADEYAAKQRRAAEEVQRAHERVIEGIRDFSEEALGDSFYASLRRKHFDFAEFFETTMLRAIANVAAAAAATNLVMPIATGVVGALPGLFGLTGQAAGGGQQAGGILSPALNSIGSFFSPITDAISSGFSGIGSYLFGTQAVTTAQQLGVSAIAGGASNVPVAAATPGLFGTYGTASLSGILGGAGLGFGAGSLLNMLVGGKSTGGMIGSGAGALAGALAGSIVPGVGTILGGLLGGAGGGLLGGMFGAGKSVGPTGVARLPNVIGSSGIELTADNGGTPDAAAEIARQIRGISTGAAERFGARGARDYGLDVGVYEDGANLKEIVGGALAESDLFTKLSPEEAITEGVRLTLQGGFEGVDLPAVATALENSAATTVQELLSDLDLAQGIGTWAAGGIEALRELQRPLGEVEQAFKTLAQTTTEGIERARTLGLSVEEATGYFAALREELEQTTQDNFTTEIRGLQGQGFLTVIEQLLDTRAANARSAEAAGLNVHETAGTIFNLAAGQVLAGLTAAQRSLVDSVFDDPQLEGLLTAANDNLVPLADFAAGLTASVQALDAQTSALESQVTAWRNMGDALQRGRVARALNPQISVLDPDARKDVAFNELDRIRDLALGGDQAAIGQFDSAADAALQAFIDFYGQTNAATVSLYRDIQRDSKAIQGRTVTQIDLLQNQLTELQGIRSVLEAQGAGGTQDFGRNPVRNRILAGLTGYTGDFGEGGFGQFVAGRNFPPEMLALIQQIDRTIPFADGGVMTSRGAMALHRYATGGIADRPQLALFGEGRMPEAFVPLPDGRSIPVTVKAAGAANDEVAGALREIVGLLRTQIQISGVGAEGAVKGLAKVVGAVDAVEKRIRGAQA